MEPQPTTAHDVLTVTDGLVGATGEEILGGPQDGSVAPILVIAQLEVAPMTSMAEDEQSAPRRVLHLGLTRGAALTLARQLEGAAALIPPISQPSPVASTA